MTYEFGQNFAEENDFAAITHLMDFADEMNLDISGLTAGLTEDMEAETMMAMKQQIEDAIAEEVARLAKIERNRVPPCYIGPYAAGWCTICGGRQPE